MAKTNVKRGLATQTYGVQNNASPGDLDAVVLGTYTRRPYGPALSGWTHGWSAHNTDNNGASEPADQQFSLSGAATTKGLAGAWFKFGPAAGGGNNLIEPLRLITGDAAETQAVTVNVSTWAVSMYSANTWFASGLDTALTIEQHRWIYLFWIWDCSTSASSLLKLYYRYAGGSDVLLASKGPFNMFTRTYGKASCGTRWQNGARVSARIGLPSVYSVDSVTGDASYPTDITEPSTSANVWYVSSAAAGSGTGVSEAQAWTPAELISEAGTDKYTLTSGPVVDPTNSNATVDTSALTAKQVNGRYAAGTAVPGGDIVYLDDSSGPIRFATQLTLGICVGGIRLLPLPSLGRRVEIRGTTRLSGSWTNISGANYKKSISCAYPVVFSFENSTEANSRTGKAKWYTHPSGITSAAGFAAASTAGSFGTDGGGGTGTEVYLRESDGSDPGSNGRVYEVAVAGGTDLIRVTCKHALIKDLILRYYAGVGTNNDGNDASLGRVGLDGDGMLVLDNCVSHAGGKHNLSLFESAISTKQRFIIINNVFSDTRPTSYGGAGGQSIIAINGATDGLDNQIYLSNNLCVTNTGVVGSTTGTIDTNNSTIVEHDTFGNTHPYSKCYAYNNMFLGATSDLGTTATTFTQNGNKASGSNEIGWLELKLRLTMARNAAQYAAERSK